MADLPPERFVSEVAPTLVSESASGPLVDAFIASTYAFHPLEAAERFNAEVRGYLRGG